MGRLLDHPMMLVVVLVLIILLFGAPKLPGMARSLGQSMRIFKSEVSEMKSDGKTSDSNGVVDGQVVDNTASTDQPTGTSQNRGGSSTPGNQA